MKISEKIKILADAAKYDASCSSSGSSRKSAPDGIGNAAISGICHSWAADGRCVSLLKILMSNECIYDCGYCINRRSNSLARATFTPEEIAELTINFYLRNYIEGLFLSSAVYVSPNKTMADMVDVCRLLRYKHGFNGYIHLKIIPGSTNDLVQQAGFLADRMSVNIELPTEASLNRLAPQKSKQGILAPMKQIGDNFTGFKVERKKNRNAPNFCPAGQTTQMIVGASAESDLQILNLTENLYNKMSLKRVYYSAYIAVNEGPLLPALSTAPPLLREHRLYQADWLLRFYKFEAHEILSPAFPNLDERLDPKAAWALRNFDLFPIDINRASYEELLRIPGIGITSAQRIIKTRRIAIIREQDLKKIGMVLKRASYFITINDKYLGDASLSHQHIVSAMCKAEPPTSKKLRYNSRQLRLFNMNPVVYLHDGTFEGLLHAVADAVKSKNRVQGIFAEHDFAPQIFDTLVRIQTDSQQAVRLFNYLKNLKGTAARFAVNGFLSDDRKVGMHLYQMVRECLVHGSRATQFFTHDSINYLEKLSQKVNFEAHRFTGLIRFRILEDGLQYAPFEPDCMVIGHCALHFQLRLKNRRWILHDIRRNHAVYWDGDILQSIDIDEDFTRHVRQHGEIPHSKLSAEEQHYQQLWKTFHTSIANKDRKNLDLQRQFMPRRYWKYLAEMR